MQTDRPDVHADPGISPDEPVHLPASPGWMTDETMTKYLEDMNNADDMDAAKKVWEKAQAYCWNDYLPIINMGHQITYYSYSDKVEGVNTLNGMHFWNAGVRE